jgi:hypothetical protein
METQMSNNEGSGLGVDAGRYGQPSRREVVIAAAMAPIMVGVGQLGGIASEIWSQAASSSPSRSLTSSLALLGASLLMVELSRRARLRPRDHSTHQIRCQAANFLIGVVSVMTRPCPVAL